jgi:hypothetical protein
MSVPTGRGMLLAMIPVNLLLVPWVWAGRVVFGVMGWFLLILVPVALLVAVALLITTILAFTLPSRPRRLGRDVRIWQWLLWGALFAFGAVMPDFGDTDDSNVSLLTQLFGHSDALFDLSFVLAALAGLAAIACWVGLLVALMIERRRSAAAR